ncbi:hypothetical protein [Methyloradius palustris]|uniref:Uncharacterized protein n=1 Tax=Methyloradius palustris TaxID=2778876 RepID=A0A8E4DGU8_9PROT|nr:hypothetical protein [Methyloradius palustris]BCM26271.1 hypothetical protein ZMTM_25300 [Methyloradius palustris]
MKTLNAIALSITFISSATAAPILATQDGLLGLYPVTDMRLTNGTCADCPTIPQALWYFQQELIAVAKPDHPVAGFSKTANAQQDVKSWSANPSAQDLNALPPLVWLGSNEVITKAELGADGKLIKLDNGGNMAFNIVPKISTNLSYFDDSSLKFFSERPVRLRGETTKAVDDSSQFTARTIWPLDFNIPNNQSAHPLSNEETLQTLVRANQGGAQSPYQTRVLWSRDAGERHDWKDKAVLGVMLNGAQGDDDEAHGGHFGIVTGQMEADGNWSRWLVNNFYNLDAYGEKGIVSAVTPADKYLMDLNNGQSYYRPSYMLVAVFKSQTLPQEYQAAINRVYNHFYRHDFVYQHAKANCAGISVDTLRSLGWNFPTRGNGGLLKATAAYFYVAATSGSLKSAHDIYEYITTEDTQLNPAAAFDALGEDMLSLAQNKTSRTLSPLEQTMSNDIEAIIMVHIPQIPSSRAFGQAPVYSFDEYLKRAPADHSQWKIIPTEPRPFPDELRDGLALTQEKPNLVPWPVGLLSFGLVFLVIWALRKLLKKRKSVMIPTYDA